MKLYCEHKYHYEMSCLTMLFFPGEKITQVEELPVGEDYVYTGKLQNRMDIDLVARVHMGGKETEHRRTVPADIKDADCERGMAVLLYELLAEVTGLRPKWGILTGVRPIKLMHRAVDQGLSETQVRRYFADEYLVSDEKLDLALTTEKNERAILSRSTPDSYSLYVSIPFCPSRCSYCSFVSHSIEKTFRLIDPYVEKLCKELEATAVLARDLGLKLRSVYIGGGTPTSLTAEQLGKITDAVRRHYPLEQAWEYTIEAGRPDTVDEEKLRRILDAGADRISINPQTFSDEVLRFVGRRHSAAESEAAFELARKVGHKNINMDLIAGLPTDTVESFVRSIDKVLELGPENVTVHTLSVKRAAELAQVDREQVVRQAVAVTEMVDHVSRVLPQAGYEPYYLYRQKNTLDNLENTGYAKPGTEGLYNVYIMDETHTILACGAGAVSKLRQPGGEHIERIFNYKYPYEYLDRFEEILKRKERVRGFYEKFELDGRRAQL